MVDGIEIREIAVGDIPEMIKIHHAIMKGNVSKTWIKDIERYLREKDVAGYAALKDGKLAGFIIGEIEGPSFGLEKSGWITVVEVHPQFMGSGIGRVLVQRLFQYFREKGVQDIFTHVLWNAVDMLSFFISAGLVRSEFINLEMHWDKEAGA